jgi:hypothetical protein
MTKRSVITRREILRRRIKTGVFCAYGRNFLKDEILTLLEESNADP